MLNIDENFMYWIAGLFEGEAAFQAPTPSCPSRPRILINSIDEDVIARVAEPFSLAYQSRKRIEKWQQMYQLSINGRNAIEVMKIIYPILSKRRQAKITTIFPINKKWQKLQPAFLLEPPKSRSLNELLWLAGLLEGEGSFMAGPPSEPNQPAIQIWSTDEDVIQRLANMWQLKYMDYERGGVAKTAYLIKLRGQRAMDLMKLLHPLMCNRRQKQIEAALASYNPNAVLEERLDRCPLTLEQIKMVKRRLKDGGNISRIAQEYNVKYRLIWRIAKGERWAWLED